MGDMDRRGPSYWRWFNGSIFAGEYRLLLFYPLGIDYGIICYSSTPGLMDVYAYATFDKNCKTVYIWPDIHILCHIKNSCSTYVAFYGSKYRCLHKETMSLERECLVSAINYMWGKSGKQHIKSIFYKARK